MALLCVAEMLCKNLMHLLMRALHDVLLACMYTNSQHCFMHGHLVQVLSLLGCTKVSDEAIAAVALHGSLRSLNVNSVPGIALSTLKALATATR